MVKTLLDQKLKIVSDQQSFLKDINNFQTETEKPVKTVKTKVRTRGGDELDLFRPPGAIGLGRKVPR